MSKGIINEEDYIEPACPFCTDMYEKNPVKMINIRRMLEKLDEILSHNDYAAAERHLVYWLGEAKLGNDRQGMLAVYNEMMGLYRKIGEKEKAYEAKDNALSIVEELSLGDAVTGATTYLNAATVYKAFGDAEKALEYYKKAQKIYEKHLNEGDEKVAGLNNNMALALCELGQYEHAWKCYQTALAVLDKNEGSELDRAITYLNMADLLLERDGAEKAEDEIADLLEKSYALFDTSTLPRDGYYAFVCEKCAGVFGYYGYFEYEAELNERAEKIYERA